MEKAMIQKIVKASGVKPNELVLVQFWGEDKDISCMHAFAEAVVSLGASPIELQQSRSVNAQRFLVANEKSYSERYFQVLSSFDAVLDIFAHRPVVLGAELGEAQTGLYRAYMASLFGALQGARRFTQIRIPNHENALETNLPPDEYVKRMISAYDIDYDQLSQEGKERIKALRVKKTLDLLTDNNCRLRFALAGREWHLDAGDGDIPCGEVYIAPLESATNGSVYFEKLYADDWGEFDRVTLTVENGVILSADHPVLNDCFAKLGVADKTICELGFGLNPNVKALCGYTVLDEKANGTFHIAIGANTMFGGANSSHMHMDFVGIGTIV